jgi:hypothetical protein
MKTTMDWRDNYSHICFAPLCSDKIENAK